MKKSLLIGFLFVVFAVLVVLFITSLRRVSQGHEAVRVERNGRISLCEPGWHWMWPAAAELFVYPVGDVDIRYPKDGNARVALKDGSEVDIVFSFRFRIPSGSAKNLYDVFGGEFYSRLDEVLEDAVEIQAAKSLMGSDEKMLPAFSTAVEGDVRKTLEGSRLSLLSASVTSWNLIEGKSEALAASVSKEPLRKIVFIGVDGGDWVIINPLIEKGKLPNFKRVIEEGATGPLRSIEPMLSPLIWTTMATGKLPEEHGILNFTQIDPETGNKIPVTRLSRKVDAFWNMMSDYGRSVDIIGWLATYPAEKINGAMVTDRVGYLAFASPEEMSSPPPAAIYPPERYQEITGLIVNSKDVPFSELKRIMHISEQAFDENKKMPFDPKNPVNNMILIYASAKSYYNMTMHLFEKDHPDFLGVYFELVDAVGHLFMPFAPPKQDGVSDEDYRTYKDAVDETYVVQDRMIGEMLERIDDNTVVMIVSDHGFKSGEARLKAGAEIWGGHAAHWHRLDGIICLYGSGIRPDYRIRGASIIDVAPTILALAGFPRAADMPGRVLEEAFEPSLLESLNHTVVATLERERAGETDVVATSGALEEAHMKKLEALGYLTAENPDALNNLGQRYQKTGEFEKAIIEYKKALTLKPRFPSALNNLGICYGHLKRYEEAEESFKKAVVFNPEDVFAMNNLAVMYLQTGKLEQARHWAEKAVAIEPKYTNARVTLGSIYATMGEFDMAEKEFQRVLEIEPGNPSAVENLKKVQMQMKRRP